MDCTGPPTYLAIVSPDEGAVGPTVLDDGEKGGDCLVKPRFLSAHPGEFGRTVDSRRESRKRRAARQSNNVRNRERYIPMTQRNGRWRRVLGEGCVLHLPFSVAWLRLVPIDLMRCCQRR